jgi:thioredoxin 1
MFKQFTKDNFSTEVLEASRTKPVLVYFFAAWCGPCQMMSPLVESLAQEIGDKAVIGKVDAEIEVDLASQYDVVGIPTFLLFKNGKIVETMVDLQLKDYLKETVEKYL